MSKAVHPKQEATPVSQFDLDAVDVDGGIREAAEHVDGETRSAFFKKAAVAGGATLTGGAIMGMLPTVAQGAPSKRQDLQILNFALTLEFLEAAFYKQAVEGGALSGQVLDLARVLNRDEQSHVSALRRTVRSLGGKPVSEPNFNFQGTTADQTKFVETSFVLENTGVRAYLGQAGRLQSKALLGAAASIATVEARHAAAIAVILGQSPFAGKRSIAASGAFERASSMKTILGEVGKTNFIES